MSKLLMKSIAISLPVMVLAACSPSTSTPSITSQQPPTSTGTRTATTAPTSTAAATSTPTPSPTATPNNVPPVIEVEIADDLKVGQRVAIDASGSYDFDQDPFEFAWSFIRMPDKYVGSDYFTGFEATIEDPASPIATFIPQHPGIYRFELSVTDIDGTSSEIIDIPIRPGAIDPIRGVAFLWWYGTSSDREAPQVLEETGEFGSSWVQFTTYWCQPSATSSSLTPCDPDTLEPISERQLTSAINMAHEKGYQVMLKPHIHVEGWVPMYQIRPSDPAEWFRAYTSYISEISTLAEELEVELLSFGNELAGTHVNEDEWADLITTIEQNYSGLLTYSDICIQRVGLCSRGFPHWDRLDYIGVSFYYNGTCSPRWGCQTPGEHIPASNQATASDMYLSIDAQLSQTLDPLVDQYGLPAIASEMGVQNVDGANYEPAGSSSLVIDNGEQAQWYEAAFAATSQRDYWEGYFLSVDPLSTPFVYDQEAPEKTYDPRDKPSEGVIRLWFGGGK